MAAIGTAGDDRLTHFATRLLNLAASLADFASCGAFRLHGFCFDFSRFFANSFFCMRKRYECKSQCECCDDLSHDLPSRWVDVTWTTMWLLRAIMTVIASIAAVSNEA